MLAAVDVDYRNEGGAVAACVLFNDWTDGLSAGDHTERIAHVEPYQPGQFYKRELPCLLAVLRHAAAPLDAVVVDGYVWLGEGHAGLGAHLSEALGRRTPVVGVAKTLFRSARRSARPVLRGGGARALWVTAAGVDLDEAAERVRRMHGTFRIPTLLKRVDHLCRTAHGGATGP
jgi:deoxyribonuclease V